MLDKLYNEQINDKHKQKEIWNQNIILHKVKKYKLQIIIIDILFS